MNALHPLGQLFQSVEDSRGWTLREIARRIERTGRTISHAYVAKLKREPIKSISYETIQALSAGLDLPERVVGAAALETMGVHDIQPAEAGAAVAIARDPSLSERDRRILLAAVREMRDDETTEAPDQQPAPARRRAMANDAEPDGVSAGERSSAAQSAPDGVWPPPKTGESEDHEDDTGVSEANRRGWPRVPATPEMLKDDRELRALRKDIDLAAREGKIDLDEERERQDREGEAGGA